MRDEFFYVTSSIGHHTVMNKFRVTIDMASPHAYGLPIYTEHANNNVAISPRVDELTEYLVAS